MPFPTTNDARTVLGHVSGGRVLDAATGDGDFIRFLLEGLRDHGEILGIDRDPVEADLFHRRFADRPEIGFELRDVLDPGIPDGSFDTVALAHSLCQFEDLSAALRRLSRLARPGGHLIIATAYRDHQDAAATMYTDLHDWWAAIDRAAGRVHGEDLRRHQVVALVSRLGLADVRLFDLDDPAQDPMDPTVLERIEGVIDRSMLRSDAAPELADWGGRLRERMRVVGFRSPVELVAVGRIRSS